MSPTSLLPLDLLGTRIVIRIVKLRPALMWCLFSLTFPLLVQGQTAQRTFVSTFGSDANTVFLCSAVNPCRGFGAAQTVTTAGGEIIALSSGGYGPVEITKAIQITAPTGVYAAITAQPGTAIGGQDAIRISAGENDVVVLRGLTLNSLNVDFGFGINFNSGLALHVEGCVINGFLASGIRFNAPGRLFVKDTVVRNGGGGVEIGFFNSPETGTIQATIDRSRIENNSSSGVVVEKAKVTITDSMSTRNDTGLLVFGGGQLTAIRTIATNNLSSGFAAAGSQLSAIHSTASDNEEGFFATGGALMVLDNCISKGNSVRGVLANGSTTIVRVSNTTVTDNFIGLWQLFALFESYGNNRVRGNTTETSGTITPVGKI